MNSWEGGHDREKKYSDSTYNINIAILDPLVGGSNDMIEKQTKTLSDSTYQTTVESAWVYKKISYFGTKNMF